MISLERKILAFRHNPRWARFHWLWNSLRPFYDGWVNLIGSHGLQRVINGTDPILILPELRGMSEQYEPNVWRKFMSCIQPDDIIVDVGAFVGLYSVAASKRLGSAGQIMSFEPDVRNFRILERQVAINKVSDRIHLVQAAIGDQNTTVAFVAGMSSQSHINSRRNNLTTNVPCLTLDRLFPEKCINLLKIDVEGFEEKVLLGAQHLLSDQTRNPRAIFIEVHPYAWPELGTTGASLLHLLWSNNYAVVDLENQPVTQLNQYGEIVALKNI